MMRAIAQEEHRWDSNNRQHRHYCGIDLPVKTMYVCILDAAGQVLVHRNVKSTLEAFLEVVVPYRDPRVVAAECMFTWYWLADVCAAEGLLDRNISWTLFAHRRFATTSPK
jgi:hypothetical protein